MSDDDAEKTPENGSSSAPASQQAADALKRATDAAELLRGRADLAAKVVAGAGTTLLTAVGLAKFSDVWPYPPGSWPAVGLLILAFGGMGAAIILIATRLWALQQPIAIGSDLETSADLTQDERNLLRPLYEQTAAVSEVDSMRAYESRAHRIERSARWLSKEDATRAMSEADQIQTEILATIARARVRVIRSRVTATLTGRPAFGLYALFAVSVLVFGLSADWLASERTDAITVAKACADARAVETIGNLPSICGPAPSAEKTPSSTPAQERANAIKELGKTFADCVAATKYPKQCRSISDAMDLVKAP